MAVGRRVLNVSSAEPHIFLEQWIARNVEAAADAIEKVLSGQEVVS